MYCSAFSKSFNFCWRRSKAVVILECVDVYHFSACFRSASLESEEACSLYHKSTFWLNESGNESGCFCKNSSCTWEKSRIGHSFWGFELSLSGIINVPPVTSFFLGLRNMESKITLLESHKITFAALLHNLIYRRKFSSAWESSIFTMRCKSICSMEFILAPFIFDFRNSINRKGLSFFIIFLRVSFMRQEFWAVQIKTVFAIPLLYV